MRLPSVPLQPTHLLLLHVTRQAGANGDSVVRTLYAVPPALWYQQRIACAKIYLLPPSLNDVASIDSLTLSLTLTLSPIDLASIGLRSGPLRTELQ